MPNLSARSSAAAGGVLSDLINQPGTFMTIPITELKVDTEYQRPISGNRIDRISGNWSWVACGVVIVALRGPNSGDYYVIDGQHRVAAAERAGIAELPCMVFESKTHLEEAQGFLDTNTVRKGMSIVDRYRALLVVQDPVAIKVSELLARANREASTQTAGNFGATRVACIDTLMWTCRVDWPVVDRVWPLVIDLCEGRLITKRVVQGLFYLERYLTNTSLIERHWRRRLMQVGYDALHKSIDEAQQYEGRAGSAVSAQGILRGVNKGLRNKLRAEITMTSSEAAD